MFHIAPLPPSDPIVLRDVTATHRGGRGIHSVDLALAGGSSTVIVGGNGAGKSTLLDVLSGGMRPESGDLGRLPAVLAAGPSPSFPSTARSPLACRSPCADSCRWGAGRTPARGVACAATTSTPSPGR
ncbi:ATP-binding cassette domain-containing protein [Mycetocola reblochoni]|uniref:ATP-binding cassette domain-containing protein n=1 Tax=Mycetocola reblochoni TaxID=331618 RepID=A0A3L6ZQ41_9MICO|nr:ATP-binding cassette domain-containing protein [Mycetocola reblochoni]